MLLSVAMQSDAHWNLLGNGGGVVSIIVVDSFDVTIALRSLLVNRFNTVFLEQPLHSHECHLVCVHSLPPTLRCSTKVTKS